jgi:hypothetical protein
MSWEADVAGIHGEESLQWKCAIVPVFLALGEPKPELEVDPFRVRVVKRHYLFGLISTKTQLKNRNVCICIRPPIY